MSWIQSTNQRVIFYLALASIVFAFIYPADARFIPIDKDSTYHEIDIQKIRSELTSLLKHTISSSEFRIYQSKSSSQKLIVELIGDFPSQYKQNLAIWLKDYSLRQGSSAQTAVLKGYEKFALEGPPKSPLWIFLASLIFLSVGHIGYRRLVKRRQGLTSENNQGEEDLLIKMTTPPTQLHKKIQALQLKARIDQATISQLKEEMNGLNSIWQQTIEKKEGLHKEIQKLKQKNLAADQTIIQLKREILDLKKSFKSNQKTHKRVFTNKIYENNQLKNYIEELQAELSAFKSHGPIQRPQKPFQSQDLDWSLQGQEELEYLGDSV